MSWPDVYTYNFCPDPSVETDATGYAAIIGTETVAQDTTLGWSGTCSLKVTTPGSVPGEGASTPEGTVVAAVTGAASAYIWGETGDLTIQAVDTSAGQVLGQTQITLDGSDWQRVVLNDLTLTANDNIQLLVFTTLAEAVTFWIDAVQYEPESPAHAYIDGNSPNCTWTGTPNESPSYQEYEFPVSLEGGMVLDGTIVVVAQGEVFQVGPISGYMDMSGADHPMIAVSSPSRAVIPPAVDPGIPGTPWEIAGGGNITSLVIVTPGSGFSKFGIWETGTDPDPAMTLIGWNNAGIQDASETATSWSQVFGTFSPPQQELTSQGTALWQSAAYMAAGFRIASQAAWAPGSPNAVNVANVQVEKQTQQGPTSYQLPRALNTIVKPTRMNYVTNPSFENNTTGWTAISSSGLSQVPGGFSGSNSMQVSVSAAGGGAYTVVEDLILGDTYIASVYVAAVSTNINDITLGVGALQDTEVVSTYASSVEFFTPYGSGEYGAGPYGGENNPGVAITPGEFVYRPYIVFQATQSSVILSLQPVAITGAAYPLIFDVDAVMVEPGEIINPYADGSTEDWEWELGGTPGNSRSYYYERYDVGVNTVQSVLSQHIPLGISAYPPQWAVPATQ